MTLQAVVFIKHLPRENCGPSICKTKGWLAVTFQMQHSQSTKKIVERDGFSMFFKYRPPRHPEFSTSQEWDWTWPVIGLGAVGIFGPLGVEKSSHVSPISFFSSFLVLGAVDSLFES